MKKNFNKQVWIDLLLPLGAVLLGLVYPTVGLTLLVEWALLWAFFRYDRLLFGVAGALNLLTQFGLILVLHALTPHYRPAVVVGEVLVVLVEWAGYVLAGHWVRPIWRRGDREVSLNAKNAYMLSLGLNVISFLAGLWLPV
jgi:hypothetical protein